MTAREQVVIPSSGYLVALNEKFLTQLVSDLLLQIEQLVRLIGINLEVRLHTTLNKAYLVVSQTTHHDL